MLISCWPQMACYRKSGIAGFLEKLLKIGLQGSICSNDNSKIAENRNLKNLEY